MGRKFFIETQYHEPSWWAGNSGTQAMMLSPCPPVGHAVWRGLFVRKDSPSNSVPEKRTRGDSDNNQDIGPEKGPFSSGAPGGMGWQV